MGKLLKFLLGSVVVILVVAVIALFIIAGNLGGILQRGINDYGPDVLGVPVSVESVDVSLLGGKASLNGLALANPAGFSKANAFELERVALALDLQSLQTDVVVIEEISVDGAAVLAEQIGSKINLQVLKDQLARATASGGSSQTGTEDGGEMPNVAIARFSFTNASARVVSEQLGEQQVSIPAIELKDIGTPEEGVTLENATQAVMQPLMKIVIAEVQEQALDQLVEKEIDKALDKAIKSDKVKGFMDKLKL